MVALTILDLSVHYGNRQIIRDMNASLQPGSITALIGPNGAGKSTLLKAIAGLQPASGRILINGGDRSPAERLRSVAYMPQDTNAGSSLSMLEVVLLGRLSTLGWKIPPPLISEAENLLERFGLAVLSHCPLSTVSGGQRQLTFLAQALFRKPEILLLDEPTAALDLRHQLIVLEMVRRTAKTDGITIAVAMHDLSLAAQFADHVLCLSDGTMESQGPPREVLTSRRLAGIYGVETEILEGSDGGLRITPLRAL